jgi:small-conductance mechanosensitive channel
MRRKTKLQVIAEEIAKLERQVNRRHNQLEKMGVETDRPQKEKPKTVKQAKEIIFKMESYLRHTSTNKSVRKGAERGKKIKEFKREEKQMDRVYKDAKKLREEASKAFRDMIKNPINQDLKNRGIRPLDFENILDEFTIGSNPKDIQNKKVRDEFRQLYQSDSSFLKNHPVNSGELFVDSKIAEYKRDVLEQLHKGADVDAYADAMDVLLSMDNKDFMKWYLGNESAINTLKYKYPERKLDWGSIESLTDSLFESLGVKELEEV